MGSRQQLKKETVAVVTIDNRTVRVFNVYSQKGTGLFSVLCGIPCIAFGFHASDIISVSWILVVIGAILFLIGVWFLGYAESITFDRGIRIIQDFRIWGMPIFHNETQVSSDLLPDIEIKYEWQARLSFFHNVYVSFGEGFQPLMIAHCRTSQEAAAVEKSFLAFYKGESFDSPIRLKCT